MWGVLFKWKMYDEENEVILTTKQSYWNSIFFSTLEIGLTLNTLESIIVLNQSAFIFLQLILKTHTFYSYIIKFKVNLSNLIFF